jgi:glycosyltransferase involved in cell wall biosynthesis
MRIVFMTSRYWPAIGGVEKYMHRLCQAFLQMGHAPVIVTGAHQDGLADHEEYEGVPVFRYPATRSPMRCWWHLTRLRPLFLSADVIHISDVWTLEYFYRMLAWTLPRKPLFLTRHGMSYRCPVPETEKTRAIRSLSLVDGVVHDGCFIETWVGVKADCVPNQGLYPEADDLPEIPEPPPDRATFVGRIEPDSGIGIYVDAIGILRRKHGLNIRLDAYGDGSMMSQLRSKIEREQLPVTMHGWRRDAQERVTDGCFAFIDGRMAMQEAMARRRLVVAAYVDPLKRDYVNGEPFSPYLVSGGDAETIADHVAHFARHDTERHELTRRAFEHARTLSWQKTACQYMELWEKAPRRTARRQSLMERAKLALALEFEARSPQPA